MTKQLNKNVECKSARKTTHSCLKMYQRHQRSTILATVFEVYKTISKFTKATHVDNKSNLYKILDSAWMVESLHLILNKVV